MKKTLFVSIMSAVILAAFSLPAFAVDAPADGLSMAKTKSAVVFNHSTHKQDCKECHHTWDGAAAVKKCSDAGCHDNFDKKDKSVHSYYKAIHDKKAKKAESCVKCHAEAAGKDKAKKKALVGCKKSACHK